MSKSMQRWRRRLLKLALSLILFATSTALAYTLEDSETKQVTLEYVRTNVGSGTLTDVRIYVGVPQQLPEQALIDIHWTPSPSAYVYDAFGQCIAQFNVGTLLPGQSAAVEMKAVGVFSKISYDIDPMTVGSLESIPSDIRDLYTRDGPYHRITDPLIVTTAEEVVGEERNPYSMAVLIHDYVAETMEYEDPGTWDDAVTALTRGTGSCSEFTFVFIALARAAGLPARFAGGSRCQESVDAAGHRWAEVYLPNPGWIPFDAQADDVPPGTEARHDWVAAHKQALILVQGGGTDDRYLKIDYRFRTTWNGSSELARQSSFTWTDVGFPSTAAVFRIDKSGSAYADGAFWGSSFQAGSADIAEWVPVSEPVESGDVLELDPEHPGAYRKTWGAGSTLVAGVVSSSPGVALGQKTEPFPTALLALAGIVPVKVTDEGGPIQCGDLLIPSSTPGAAMRWDPSTPRPPALIAKALETMKGSAGVILALLVK